MSLQDFTTNNSQNDHIFHSNAYAKVAQGGTLGSTNSQTFEQRREIHRNRQAVSHYGNSLIGRGDMKDQSHADMEGGSTDERSAQPPMYQRRARSIGVPARGAVQRPQARPSFREPPARGYNPFG